MHILFLAVSRGPKVSALADIRARIRRILPKTICPLSECPIDPRDLQELARAKLPCLLLSFTLPSGSYATVCLREMAR